MNHPLLYLERLPSVLPIPITTSPERNVLELYNSHALKWKNISAKWYNNAHQSRLPLTTQEKSAQKATFANKDKKQNNGTVHKKSQKSHIKSSPLLTALRGINLRFRILRVPPNTNDIIW